MDSHVLVRTDTSKVYDVTHVVMSQHSLFDIFHEDFVTMNDLIFCGNNLLTRGNKIKKIMKQFCVPPWAPY